jgi:hypothetical protein
MNTNNENNEKILPKVDYADSVGLAVAYILFKTPDIVKSNKQMDAMRKTMLK